MIFLFSRCDISARSVLWAEESIGSKVGGIRWSAWFMWSEALTLRRFSISESCCTSGYFTLATCDSWYGLLNKSLLCFSRYCFCLRIWVNCYRLGTLSSYERLRLAMRDCLELLVSKMDRFCRGRCKLWPWSVDAVIRSCFADCITLRELPLFSYLICSLLLLLPKSTLGSLSNV